MNIAGDEKNSVAQLASDELANDNLTDRTLSIPESKATELGEYDPENPRNWAPLHKWSMAMVASALTMLSIFATMMIMPASPQVIEDLHSNDILYETLLVSIWDLGEGVGPFIVAPLSERFGRLPVFHGGNFLGVLCLVASALSTNIQMLIAFRFLSGFVLPTLTLTPTIIGDLFAPQERGTAMAFGMCLRMLGPLVAPVCGGYIAQTLGWRWTLWINAIALGVLALICVAVMRETYPPKILERRETLLPKESNSQPHRTHIDYSALFRTMIQPLKVLFLTPTVLFITVYTGFASGILYIIFTTLASIMESNYNYSQGKAGLAFLAPAIGIVGGMLCYAFTSDRYIRYQQKKDGGIFKARHRLVHMVLGSVILPIGTLVYGWTLAARTPSILPLVGTGILGCGVMLAILPNENYLVDAFPLNSASSVAAGVIVRALFGAVFPLTGPPLYQRLGYGWGNSVLVLVSVMFIPPLLILAGLGRCFRMRRSS